ncbi:hypothetical protein BDV24DRAFT_169304 [Aspergillus arachidicola]|uniref:Integral membrane protein n=1 Tax=Aspergillus arachidicola TaxID=656916 RepID=A0A5N6XQ96_9EURO|nr:hypothetical protein BDV24DRAFT_169304 [Aspergillus arachidicola]
MATNTSDIKLAAAAAGFTLGFGTLTVWEAVRQTKAHLSPHRSPYIWMVWGEIAANVGIGVVGWLFLEKTIPLGVPVLCSLLAFWVLEVQLLMQIIVNRIRIIADSEARIVRIRWLVAAVVSLINVAVFCVWVPAHLDPPPSTAFTTVNKYWDRISKILILLVDAALNIWFVRVVQRRLVQYYGLSKYAPLARVNAWLIVVSIGMDVLLIGLMSLHNPLVYIQFHPVVYTVKLKIELSMADLLRQTAQLTVVSQQPQGFHTSCFASPRSSPTIRAPNEYSWPRHGIYKTTEIELHIDQKAWKDSNSVRAGPTAFP